MEGFRKWCIGIVLFMFIPFFIPICYAIFGSPTPDQWQQTAKAKYEFSSQFSWKNSI